MRYFSTTTCQDVEIDPAAAELPAVLDAYNSLFDMADSGGAFPGSFQSTPVISGGRNGSRASRCHAKLFLAIPANHWWRWVRQR